MGEAAALRHQARALGRELRRAIPDTYRAYAQLHGAVLEPGALDTGTKELIALAIAVTRECDGCIAAHAEGAARSGATAEQVAEAIGVAILMNGGPATVFGPRAFAAFREFAAEAPVHRTATGAGPTAPHRHGSGNADTPTTATGRPPTDARLDRLLHDLDVANDVPGAGSAGGRPRP
jgi:AhpD family alkylhydroperoxidase